MGRVLKTLARFSQMRGLGLAMVLILLCSAVSFVNPNFFSLANLSSIARQAAVMAIGAVGQTMVIITGGIDLSQGAILAFVSVVSALAIKSTGWILGCLVGLILGAAIGGVQGLLVARIGIPAFIVTLGGLQAWRGAAFIASAGMPVTGDLPEIFLAIGNGSIKGVPVPAVIAVVVLSLGAWVMKYTVFGRHVYAVGGGEDAAFLSGVPVVTVKTAAYLISGLLVALGALVMTARISSGQPIIGETYQLECIAAAVIGGTSLSGGEGTISGTLLGVLIMSMLSNGLNLMHVSSFIQMVAVGGVIVAAVFWDMVQKR